MFKQTIHLLSRPMLIKRINKILQKFTTFHSWQKPEGHDTGIKVYNCVTRKNVPIILREKNFANWYTCGPTVYDSSHIGHASSYVKIDIIQRILKDYFNINLVTAINITDIDDKIIAKSKGSTQQWYEIARQYEEEFWNDLNRLNIMKPDVKIRVTENIPLIVKFIREIIAKDHAYISADNSVYFKINSFPNYGKLQHLNLNDVEDQMKESRHDFALWKGEKEGEPSWSTLWGKGRPGWHIECSALASKVFGNAIDFHAGGLDLRFPHHENEEAQSCVFHNREQWVNYWIHTGQLSIKGEADKMSKSLKNTISISDLLVKYTSDDFRMACALSNYRNSMEYGNEMMETAKNSLRKFIEFNSDCHAYIEGLKNPAYVDFRKISETLQRVAQLVDSSLKDDFDTSKTIRHLLELVGTVSKEINKSDTIDDDNVVSTNYVDTIGAANQFIRKILRIFGFQCAQESFVEQNMDTGLEPNQIVDEIVAIRDIIRSEGVLTKNKELFKISDIIRDNLKRKGIEIKDHKNGSSWNFSHNKI